MKYPLSSIKTTIYSFLVLTIGSMLAAFSIEAFLLPNKILDGGVVGISMILAYLFPVRLAIFVVLINIPFLILGYIQLGKGFFIKSVYSIACFSIMLELFHGYDQVTNETILSVIYGGLFLGAGVGIVIKNGGCLDGTEALGILINRKFSISVGKFVLVCNVIIYSVAGLLFGLDRAMFSLLTYFITSKVVDYVNEGLEQGKAVMIITDHGKDITDRIFYELGRTVTILEGEGMVSGKKVVLYCVVTRFELFQMKKIVQEDEGSAFMTITDVSEIVGQHVKGTKRLSKEEA